jgi:dihydroxyacetone kinase-like protein
MLDAAATAKMLIHVAGRVTANKNLLTEADKMGDADHGIGMARGFTAVEEKLKTIEASSPAEVFRTAGLTLMSSVGGAAGAIFGTLFQKGAAVIAEAQDFDADAFRRFLAAGLDAVKRRGGAKPGDKTVVDALEPAVTAAEDGDGLESALSAAAAAARSGMENTKTIAARIGKMKTLGDRSIGYADPGALSITIILEAMRDFVKDMA